MLSIQDYLPRARRLYGNRRAVYDERGWITYEELGRRVDRLAGALVESGLKPSDRVAILDVNSRGYLEAYYACAQIGLILVPINSRLSGGEVAYILKDCAAKVLLFSNAYADMISEYRIQFDSIEIYICSGSEAVYDGIMQYEAFLSSATLCTPPIHMALPKDIAQIYYTSGTTGHPKGVMLSFESMALSALDAIIGLGLTRDDHWLHAAPLFHLVDAWAVWAMPLMGGQQSVVHFSPDRLLTTIQNGDVTATALPPTLLEMVANDPRRSGYDISCLRFIMYGGSPMTLGALTRASDALGIKLIHAYGTTETSGIVTLFNVPTPKEMLELAPTTGQSVPNIQIEIRDDAGGPVAAGEIGEVVIAGPRVMLGYWNKPNETSEVLDNNVYKSGDLGIMDAENNLTVVDRKKDMIISGGENVYSAEIENVLSNHANIAEVAVIGIPSEQWGEAVHAIVVLQNDVSLTEDDLAAWCHSRIARYKIPKSFYFHPGPLPKTPAGKIAKRTLREPFWADRERTI